MNGADVLGILEHARDALSNSAQLFQNELTEFRLKQVQRALRGVNKALVELHKEQEFEAKHDIGSDDEAPFPGPCASCGNSVSWKVSLRTGFGSITVWLHVGHQSFPVGSPHDNASEAVWYASQLQHAMHVATCESQNDDERYRQGYADGIQSCMVQARAATVDEKGKS